jgi:hypothetical protein
VAPTVKKISSSFMVLNTKEIWVKFHKSIIFMCQFLYRKKMLVQVPHLPWVGVQIHDKKKMLVHVPISRQKVMTKTAAMTMRVPYT